MNQLVFVASSFTTALHLVSYLANELRYVCSGLGDAERDYRPEKPDANTSEHERIRMSASRIPGFHIFRSRWPLFSFGGTVDDGKTARAGEPPAQRTSV